MMFQYRSRCLPLLHLMYRSNCLSWCTSLCIAGDIISWLPSVSTYTGGYFRRCIILASYHNRSSRHQWLLTPCQRLFHQFLSL